MADVIRLPPLPSLRVIADVCEAVAAREQVDAIAVEKDFYLSRILWALGQALGDQVLLKGGTLLSKVDLGYFRMSEDIDLVLPVDLDGSLSYGTVNIGRLGQVYAALTDVAAVVGVTLGHPDGVARYAHKGGRLWEARYVSTFTDRDNLVQIETTIRRVLRPPRRVLLEQLANGALAIPRDSGRPWCFALDGDEARAEKVRAAFDRSAIRDFYDLSRLRSHNADFTSASFLDLVDQKLAEVKRAPLARQPVRFGKSAAELEALERQIDRSLVAVVRFGEPRFDLGAMLDDFDALWGKEAPRSG